MGVTGLLEGLFTNGHAKLTKTTRPYYLQSLSLVYACRQIPEPPRENHKQLKDLEKLFSRIEEALRLGTLPSDKEAATRAFEQADMALRNYLADHHVRFKESNSQVLKGRVVQAGALQDAAKGDLEAEKNLTLVNDAVQKKLLLLNSITKRIFPLQFWLDYPIKFEIHTNKVEYNSHRVDIKIEETATLDMLLHRLLEHNTVKTKDKEGRSHQNSIRLLQYPQFYPDFPSTQASFDSVAKRDGDGIMKIKSLQPWEQVKKVDIPKHGALQLIVERKPNDSRRVQLGDGSHVEFPHDYKNAWALTDSRDTVAVRSRNCSFSLSTWQPHMKRPSSTMSASTLVPSMPVPVVHTGGPAPSPPVIPRVHQPNAGPADSDTTLVASPTPPISHNMPKSPPVPDPAQPAKVGGSSPYPPTPIPGGTGPTNSSTTLVATSTPPISHTMSTPQVTVGGVLPAAPINSSPPPQTHSKRTDSQASTSVEEPENDDDQGQEDGHPTGTALPSFKGRTMHGKVGMGSMGQVVSDKKKKKGGFRNWVKGKLEQVARPS